MGGALHCGPCAAPAACVFFADVLEMHLVTRDVGRGLAVSSIPPDLRKLKKPVHIRLSPASAGTPGDDISDVEIIREEWLRQKVEDELFSRAEKVGLKCVSWRARARARGAVLVLRASSVWF